MIVRSLLRMKTFVTAMILVMILTGYALSATVSSMYGYGVSVAEEAVRQTRPNMRIQLIAPLQPGGRMPLLEALGVKQSPGLHGIIKGTEEAWQTLAGSFLSGLGANPLVGCHAGYTLLGGTNYGGPLHLYIKIAASTSETPTYVDKELLGKPWILPEARKYREILFLPVMSSTGEVVPFVTYPPGNTMYRGGIYTVLWEPVPILHIPHDNENGSSQVEIYYARDLYIAIVDPGILGCLGISSTPPNLHAAPGDGVLDAMISPLLGSILGIPPGESREYSVGGVSLRLWALGPENPYYASKLSAPSYGIPYLNISMYETAFTLITFPEEEEDLQALLAQGLAGGTAGLEAYLFARHVLYPTAAPPGPRSLPSGEGPMISVSLIYQYNLGLEANASGIVRDMLGPLDNLSNATSLEEVQAASSFASHVHVINYSPLRVAKAPIKELVNNMNGLTTLIEGLGARVQALEPAAECNESTYAFTGLYLSSYAATYYDGGLRAVRPGSGWSSPCTATLLVEDVSAGPIFLSRSRSIFMNPLLTVSMVSIVPAILAIAWVMQSNITTILVGGTRRWMAIAIARGLSPSKARRGLILLGLLLGPVSVAAGVILGYLHSHGAPASPRLLVAVGATGLAIVLLSMFRRSREVLEIKAEEAVRPALSIARLPLGGRGRLGALAVVLYLLSVGFGLSRLSDETLSRLDDLGLIAIPIYILLTIAFMASPFAPLLGLTQGSTLGATLFSSRRMARAVSALYMRLFSDLGAIAARGGEKLRDALLSGVGAVGLGLGLTIGSSLAASALSPRLVRSLVEAGELDLSLRIGVGLVSGTLLWVAVAGILFALVMTLAVVLSVVDHLRRQVVVLRARGASRRQAVAYVYASFTPFIVASILTGLLSAGAFYLGLDAVIALANLEDMSKMPHLVPSLSLGTVLLPLLGIVAVVAVPGLVSLRVVRERDIARLIREGV